MSFGFSVEDFIAATELIFSVCEALRKTQDSQPEFQQAKQDLDDLSDVLREIERIGLDNFRKEQIDVIKRVQLFRIELQQYVDAVFPVSIEARIHARLGMHNHTRSRLHAQARERLITFCASTVAPQTQLMRQIVENQKIHYLAIGGELPNIPQKDSNFPRTRSRGCIIVAALFVTFISLSCFLGVYFTIEKHYGYSMGDAFALAGYVVAVWTLISGAFLAYHYPHCRCWKQAAYKENERHEMTPLTATH